MLQFEFVDRLSSIFFSLILPSALLFSATFKKKVEMLCRDILTDPIRVVVGELGEVRKNSLPPIVVSSEKNNTLNCVYLSINSTNHDAKEKIAVGAWQRKTRVGTRFCASFRLDLNVARKV